MMFLSQCLKENLKRFGFYPFLNLVPQPCTDSIPLIVLQINPYLLIIDRVTFSHFKPSTVTNTII